MQDFALIVLILSLVSLPVQVWSAEKLSCTIERSLTTGDILEKPMISTETVSIEARPFGKSYIFSLAPAKAECELRISDPKGGTFLNCWTQDKMHGFRSDRTTIDKQKGVENTLSYADGEKGVVVQIKVRCK